MVPIGLRAIWCNIILFQRSYFFLSLRSPLRLFKRGCSLSCKFIPFHLVGFNGERITIVSDPLPSSEKKKISAPYVSVHVCTIAQAEL